MRKFTLLTVAAAFVATAAFTQTAFATDGVYKARQVGRNGGINVEVTIKDSKIADIKVLDWSETHPVADLTQTQLIPEMIKYQSTRANNVTGATLTSFALKAAVDQCIKEAGLNVEDFHKAVPKPETYTDTVEETADLVVVGAGGAGVSAALTAAENGKKVIVIEKNAFVGGNTGVSGGAWNVANIHQEELKMTEGQKKILEETLAIPPKNELHEKMINTVKKQWADHQASGKDSLFDSPEYHALQSWKSGDFQGDLALVYTLTSNGHIMVNHLAEIGYDWTPKATQVIGAMWPRALRGRVYKAGIGYIDTMIKYINDNKLPVQFILDTTGTELIKDSSGRVTGVKAQNRNGRKYVLTGTEGVVLATGGFGANPEMRNEYDELWGKKLGPKVPTTNLPSALGEGVKMAKAAGAGLVDMGLIQLFPAGDPATGAMSFKVAENSCIYVNKNGKRYVNESERRDVLAKAALAQPDQVFFVITSDKRKLIDKNGRNDYGIYLQDILNTGKTIKADTLEELATKLGMDPKNLVETVDKWNKFCQTGKDDEMGRPLCMDDHRLDEGGPYYATIMSPAVHHTMGGVRINTKAQVLDTEGKVIPGLFAAGEVTGGIHGTNRVGGNAVPDAIVFGHIAAETAIGKNN